MTLLQSLEELRLGWHWLFKQVCVGASLHWEVSVRWSLVLTSSGALRSECHMTKLWGHSPLWVKESVITYGHVTILKIVFPILTIVWLALNYAKKRLVSPLQMEWVFESPECVYIQTCIFLFSSMKVTVGCFLLIKRVFKCCGILSLPMENLGKSGDAAIEFSLGWGRVILFHNDQLLYNCVYCISASTLQGDRKWRRGRRKSGNYVYKEWWSFDHFLCVAVCLVAKAA